MSDAMKRSQALRAELRWLETERTRWEASKRNSVEEEAPPQQERRTETHQTGRRSTVYDTKSPLSYGLQVVGKP